MKKKHIAYAILAAALLLVVASFAAAHRLAMTKVIDPATYDRAGRTLKEKFPAYAELRDRKLVESFYQRKLLTDQEFGMFFLTGKTTISDESLGKALFGKGYILPAQYEALRNAGMSDRDIYDLVGREYKHPLWLRLAWYVGWLALALALAYAARSLIGRLYRRRPIDSAEFPTE